MKKPYLIVVTGRPGSGKTTLSKKLSEKLFLPLISRDQIKEGYVHTFRERDSQLPEQSNKIVTDIFFKTISDFLDNRVSLIVEAAFQHKVWKLQLDTFAKKAQVYLLICIVNDEIALERFVRRGLNDPARAYFHTDEGIDLARKGLRIQTSTYDEPELDVPTFHIDTTGDYIPSINELSGHIFGNRYADFIKKKV